MKNGTLRKLASGVLAAAIVLTLAPAVGGEVKAEAKAYINKEKTYQIPVGKLTKKSRWNYPDTDTGNSWTSIDRDSSGQVNVYDKEKGNKITYKSSNTKVVTVDKKGYLTGKKKGSAKITVKSGKRKLGTVKVTVGATSLIKPAVDNTDYFNVNLGEDESVLVLYQKPGAKYTATTDKEGLTLTPSDDGCWFNTEATTTGEYTVTIKEKYKKKTRTIGNTTITVHAPQVKAEPVQFYIGQKFGDPDLCDYYYNGVKPEIVSGKDTVIKDQVVYEDGLANEYYEAVGEGTAQVRYTAADGTDLGTATVNIVANHCVSLKLNSDVTYYDRDTDEDVPGVSISMDYDKVIGLYDWYFDVTAQDDEYLTSDQLSITSDDESVAKASYVNDYTDDNGEDYTGWLLTAVAPGKTTLTVTCGSQTLKVPVRIYPVEY